MRWHESTALGAWGQARYLSGVTALTRASGRHDKHTERNRVVGSPCFVRESFQAVRRNAVRVQT